jgi:NodT family efflux transporter outer membrane factor (OMF) lipoprotein
MRDSVAKSNSVRASIASFIALLLCALPACLLGPKYHPPKGPTPAAPNYKESTVNFKNTEGWKVASPQDAKLPAKWWEIFDDPDLNALEEQLNINNQTIREYFENLVEARSIVREAHAQYWPTVTASPSWTRQKSSSNLTNSTFANTGQTSTLMSFPLDVAWIPDFWGKIRNEVREAQYAAQVSAADLADEQLIEQASLAAYYFEIRGQDALAKILDETVQADQKALDVTLASYQTGVGDYISVSEARATLEAVQSADINVKIARAQYEHAIAVLVGKVATDFSIPVHPELRQPPPLPVGVPAELLERRPDVAAAERTLAEANAIIGIGYGAFFPQVTLSAAGGFESSTFAKWFTWPSRFWSIGPSISQVIFNAGLYRAELDQYTATYNADLALYRETVLTAFEQVEDYLAAVHLYSQQIERQQAAVRDAAETFRLEMGRYETGIDPYVDVTTAQATLLSDQETLATIQVEEMTSAVSLIEALGGGWDLSQLPKPSELGKKLPKSETKLQQ